VLVLNKEIIQVLYNETLGIFHDALITLYCILFVRARSTLLIISVDYF